MDAANYITYAAALAIAAVIPGPGIIALVARALGSGFRATFPMLIGIVIGDVVYLSAAVLGLAWIAAQFGIVFTILKYAGAAYLLWMAIGFWRSGVSAEDIRARSAAGPMASCLAGLLVTLGNPKAIIFYLALLPNLFDLRAVGLQQFGGLVGLTFLVLVVTLTPYIALAGRARLLMQSPRALKFMNRFAALCLGGAAAVIATRAA